MRFYFLILIALFLVGCNSTSPQEKIEGTWIIDGELPFGSIDGWEAVITGKEISFDGLETYMCNGDICRNTINTDIPTTGRYILAEGVISLEGCGDNLLIDLTENELIIKYSCDEGCWHRYQRVN